MKKSIVTQHVSYNDDPCILIYLNIIEYVKKINMLINEVVTSCENIIIKEDLTYVIYY